MILQKSLLHAALVLKKHVLLSVYNMLLNIYVETSTFLMIL